MALASNLHGGRRVGDQEGVSLVTTIRPAEEGNGNEEGQGQGDPRPDANQPRHCVLASKAPVLALDLEPSHLARCPATPGADDRRSSHALRLGGAFFAFHLPRGVLTFALLGRLNGSLNSLNSRTRNSRCGVAVTGSRARDLRLDDVFAAMTQLVATFGQKMTSNGGYKSYTHFATNSFAKKREMHRERERERESLCFWFRLRRRTHFIVVVIVVVQSCCAFKECGGLERSAGLLRVRVRVRDIVRVGVL